MTTTTLLNQEQTNKILVQTHQIQFQNVFEDEVSEILNREAYV